MNKLFRSISIVLVIAVFGILSANAQPPKKDPDYKITNIKIVPFNEQTGAFENEIALKGDDRSFFNDLNISLFVTVEIGGKAGSFSPGRKIEITILEGKRVKLKKLEQIGLIGEGGQFYVPVWLYSAMCSDVKITARIVGQKTASSMKRTVPFLCGE